jgi:hypothetical protein
MRAIEVGKAEHQDEIEAVRQETLAKLLQHGLETVEGLTRITGWGEQETQRTLLSLIAGGRAKCTNVNGRRLFGVRHPP